MDDEWLFVPPHGRPVDGRTFVIISYEIVRKNVDARRDRFSGRRYVFTACPESIFVVRTSVIVHLAIVLIAAYGRERESDYRTRVSSYHGRVVRLKSKFGSRFRRSRQFNFGRSRRRLRKENNGRNEIWKRPVWKFAAVKTTTYRVTNTTGRRIQTDFAIDTPLPPPTVGRTDET